MQGREKNNSPFPSTNGKGESLYRSSLLRSPFLRFFFDGGLDHAPGDDEGFLGDGQGEACAVAALGQAILAGETFSGNCTGGFVAVEANAALLCKLFLQGVQELGWSALDRVREGSGHVYILPF